MSSITKNVLAAIAAAAAAVAVTGGLALASSPVASAKANSTISATGGDNTAVDHDGTQGDFADAVQGSVDTDGDQDARDLTNSWEATPQDKATPKK